jgi:hypothetical protein
VLPPDPRSALELLDFEWLLKNLLEHHHARERSFLLPFLRKCSTPQGGSATAGQAGPS